VSPTASTSAETVLLRVEDGVAWITLNRPDRLNAFAGTMRDDLHDAIDRAASSPDVRVLVITGAGRGFCTGADVEVMSDLLQRGDDATFGTLVEAGMRVVGRLR
jgi:enoyl-CoA hydratase/carnithine racemase